MIEILNLGKVPYAIVPLTEAFCAEWPGTDAKETEKRFRAFAQNDRIPMVFAAVEGDRVLGAVGLLERSGPSRPDLSPWVGALYVRPECRHQGLGARLIRAAEEEASALGFAVVHASTHTAVSLFARSLAWDGRPSMSLRTKEIATASCVRTLLNSSSFARTFLAHPARAAGTIVGWR